MAFNMSQPRLILGIGELLWDAMPDGMRLGGAPANFAVMAGRLGNRAVILSRVGSDDLGRQAIGHLEPMPVEAGFLQIDTHRQTGRVTVHLVDGEPSYTIHQPAAWDFLELSDEWLQLAQRAHAICFGTLAQRHLVARQTIETLAAETSAGCIRVFDVNLRPPFYSAEVIEESLELATVVKMNDAETPVVLDLLDLSVEGAPAEETLSTPEYLRQAAERLLGAFSSLQMVAITRGSRGSLLVTREAWHEHPGIRVKVADAIGAGDAFTAALVHFMLQGASLATLNEAGNRWGAWVASQCGAMPPLPSAVRAAITAAIEEGNSP